MNVVNSHALLFRALVKRLLACGSRRNACIKKVKFGNLELFEI